MKCPQNQPVNVFFSNLARGQEQKPLRGREDVVCRTGNVKVLSRDNGAIYNLHGCAVVRTGKKDRTIELETCGHHSNTTKAHINGVLSALGTGKKLVQRKGTWYLDGQKFEEGDTLEY